MAFKRIVLQPLLAQTASGAGGLVSLPTIVAGDLFVNLTAISGATATIDAYLQASDDGGTTWYDVPCDLKIKTVASATEDTASANKRDVLDGVTATGKFFARYAYLNSDAYRLAWIISGTTPSVTFSAVLLAK